jgi:sec-independent protein translocase protein TatB
VFDLSLPKLLVLAVLALIMFGPHELPKFAAQAGRALHDLRRIADGAKTDLREGLGPEFCDFDLDDLNPRRFVQKHLLTGLNRDDPDGTEASGKTPAGHRLPGRREGSLRRRSHVALAPGGGTAATSISCSSRPGLRCRDEPYWDRAAA